MISDFVKSVVGVAVVIVVIVAVAIPIISNIGLSDPTYDNGDTVARYSAFDYTNDISITLYHDSMSINGDVVYELNDEVSKQGFPLIVSENYVILANFDQGTSFARIYEICEGRSADMGTTEITINISANGEVTGGVAHRIAEELMIYDPNGDYGVYWSDGLNAEHVLAAKDENIIQICTIDVPEDIVGGYHAYLRLKEGEIVSSNYIGCSEGDYPVILDATDVDGCISYGFVSIEPLSDYDWKGIGLNFALAPIESKPIQEFAIIDQTIQIIPLIMVAGLIIGVAGTFLYRRLS